MKKLIIFICILACVCSSFVVTSAEDKTKKVVISSCESLDGWSKAGAGLDDTSRVQGKYSFSVSSVWPNAKLNIDKTIVEKSGISYDEAYFEMYVYIPDVSKHTKSGYYKLSADYAFNDADGNDANETNIFKIKFSALNYKNGWNFFSIKFTDMEFVGEKSKEEVYNNLSKFFFVDPAKNIPGIPSDKPLWEKMYMLKVNFDEMAISNAYREIAQEDIEVLSTQRYGDVTYINGIAQEQVIEKETNYSQVYNMVFILSSIGIFVVGVGLMLIIKLKKGGKTNE